MTYALGLRCPNCEENYPLSVMVNGCPACRTSEYVSNVEVTYDFEKIASRLNRETLATRPATMWRYAELLPVSNPGHVISLGEGLTPLVPLPSVGQQMGLRRLYLKNEGINPTWSYKDRMCSVAISMAVEMAAPGIVASSSGNHGASAAAYAARAGLPCIVLTLPDVPEAMKVLMQAYGAYVVATPRPSDRWILAEMLVEQGWYAVTNFTAPAVGSNPFGVEGHKTIAFEIAEQLAWAAPDVVALPVGYADGLAGVWQGFTDLLRLGWIDQRPRMIAAEIHGPLANAMGQGLRHVTAVPSRRNSVAFSIASTISATQGLRALRESRGEALCVEDDEIMSMQLRLAAAEGIYVEPAAAASLAAVGQLVGRGQVGPDERVVVVASSTGLKDPAATQAHLPAVPVIAAEANALETALRDTYHFDLASGLARMRGPFNGQPT
jgi:threonine synthase